MRPKSKFDPHDPDSLFEVVVFSPRKEVVTEIKKGETAAVTLARRLLAMARCNTGLGAAIFYHDGNARRGLRRSWRLVDGDIVEL